MSNKQHKQHNLRSELKKNKSFCILPWIHHFEIDGTFYPCCHSNADIKAEIGKINQGYNSKEREKLKKIMIEGKPIDNYCSTCVKFDKQEVEDSPRVKETLYWADKLGLYSIDEIVKEDLPIMSYDLRPSNLCNLLCRTCGPHASNLIEKEEERHPNIHKLIWSDFYQDETKIKNLFGLDDIIEQGTYKKFYFAGGEPTINPDINLFLRKLIELDKTDTAIWINTNGSTFTKSFKESAIKFKDFGFIFSIDGFKEQNDYIRTKSIWENVENNLTWALNNKFKIGVNIVGSLYSLPGLYLLLEYLDNKTSPYHENVFFINITLLHTPECQSPFLFPNSELIVERINQIKQLSIYKKFIHRAIDTLFDYYTTNHSVNHTLLKTFFEYNDKIDLIRKIKLIDYIPELEECRSYLTKQT